MELRAIINIYELSELVSTLTFDEFYQKILDENHRYEGEYYEGYKRLFFRKMGEHRLGWLRKIIYKNWTIFRNAMKLRHLILGIKGPKGFYDADYHERRLFLQYQELKYQFITDEKSDARPFFDIAKDIYDNIEEYRSVYELLEDEASKKVLMGVLVSRLTGDWRHLWNLASEHPQYFDGDIIKDYLDEVVVDAGGFTGDTVEALLDTPEAKGKIKKIYLYEPNKDYLEQAKKNLSGSGIEIVFHRSGISDRHDSLFIAEGCRITDCGEEMDKVDVVALDESIDEKITFIKMDIEGSEKAALQGCRRHITEDTPKLVVCVYHKLEDVWWVPQYVKGLNPKYKFYLRYYYQAAMGDIVIYCMPC